VPRTPEGERRFQMNKPGRGFELGSEDANRRTDLDVGFRRAVLPAFGNDPEARCEPLGLSRLITFSGGGATMEMDKMAIGGWSGILEDRCVPSDESKFNEFRDHAAGKK
jgi:hypothetical protein